MAEALQNRPIVRGGGKLDSFEIVDVLGRYYRDRNLTKSIQEIGDTQCDRTWITQMFVRCSLDVGCPSIFFLNI